MQGKACAMNVAVNERRKDQNGNWADHTDWIRIVAFGKTGENAMKYLRKGKKAYFEGKLQTSKWKNGEKEVTVLNFIANEIRFLDPIERDDRSTSGEFHEPEPDLALSDTNW